jgi:MFS family permease
MQNGVSEFNRQSISSVIACASAFFLGAGPAVMGGMGLLLVAVAKDFGWSRAAFSTIALIVSVGASLTAPFFGRLIDRVGPRRVLLPGLVGFGLSFMYLAFVPQVGWMFFAGYGLVGLVMGSQVPNGYSKVICQWFVRNRGMMIALVPAVGAGLGYAVIPQAINYMIVHHGWRAAYATIGLAILLFSAPMNLFLLRERNPVSPAGAVKPEGEDEPGLSHGEALKTADFRKILTALFLASMAFYGVILHLFPLLLDRGVDRAVATTTISMLAVGVTAGQLTAGVLLDRAPTPKIGALFFLVGLGGLLLIHHGATAAATTAGAVMTGFGQGTEIAVVGYILSRLFGLKAFSSLFGIICSGGVLAGGVGPLAFGFVFDRAGSYAPALYSGELALALAVILMLTLSPYRFGGAKRAGGLKVGRPVRT